MHNASLFTGSCCSTCVFWLGLRNCSSVYLRCGWWLCLVIPSLGCQWACVLWWWHLAQTSALGYRVAYQRAGVFSVILICSLPPPRLLRAILNRPNSLHCDCKAHWHQAAVYCLCLFVYLQTFNGAPGSNILQGGTNWVPTTTTTTRIQAWNIARCQFLDGNVLVHLGPLWQGQFSNWWIEMMRICWDLLGFAIGLV